MSSVAGTGGKVGQSGYSAGTAVIGLTKTLAKEWGRFQITVNTVAFGLIKVGIGSSLLEATERGLPIGRAGTPTDGANAVYLFCTPESDYVTRQLVVCGGGPVL